MEMADKEAQSMAEEIGEVQLRIQEAEKTKKTLSAEVEKLKDLARDILNLKKTKAKPPKHHQ
jgi:hypothetical protein